MRQLCFFLMMLIRLCQLPAVVKALEISQNSGIIRVEVGQNVTLQCSSENAVVTFLSWYRQSLGGKPNIVSIRMKHSNDAEVYPEYKERFHVLSKGQDNDNHLMIRDVHLSDSAVYYCGILEFNAIEFGKGVFLHVRTSLSKTPTVVHQPAVVPYLLGESVRLNCTVHTEQCAGEQNLFWFRYDGSQSAIMHPSEKQCTTLSKEEPHSKTCTLTLEIMSVNASNPGMYYCALASCGEIVFGNGTRLETDGGSTSPPLLMVYILSVALIVSIIVLFALVSIMYKLRKKLCSVCKGSVSHTSCAASSNAMSQDEHMLHYAALSLKRNTEQTLQENSMDSVCVYSRVKSRRSEGGLQTQPL